MSGLSLHITYRYGSERFRFDPENPPKTGDLIQVEGFWREERISAVYNQRVAYRLDPDRTHEVRLTSPPN